VFDRIYQLPITSLAILAAVVFVGIYWVGCIFIRPVCRMFVRAGGDENGIVGTVLSSFGVFYGLLMSLIAVAAYQNLSDVSEVASNEASAALALYRDVADFPATQSAPVRAHLRDYCRFAIDVEWPEQRKGRVPLGAFKFIGPVRNGILDLEVTTRRTELAQAEALKHLEILTEQGRHRRFAAQTGIPAVMWYVVIVGTIINFGLMWMFDMKFITQLFLGGLLSFFIGTLILLIAVLDRPYRSHEFGVSPQPFELAYQVMMRDETGRSADTTNPEK
jgi:hypothetical protein